MSVQVHDNDIEPCLLAALLILSVFLMFSVSTIFSNIVFQKEHLELLYLKTC